MSKALRNPTQNPSSSSPPPAVLTSSELQIPETAFIQDIDDRVFAAVILQALSRIKGIALIEGKFLDNLLGRDFIEQARGIYVEQDSKKQRIKVKVELNIYYGCQIPAKAEEVQVSVSEEIYRLTGIHVDSVHVVFKQLLFSSEELKQLESNRPFSGQVQKNTKNPADNKNAKAIAIDEMLEQSLVEEFSKNA